MTATISCSLQYEAKNTSPIPMRNILPISFTVMARHGVVSTVYCTRNMAGHQSAQMMPWNVILFVMSRARLITLHMPIMMNAAIWIMASLLSLTGAVGFDAAFAGGAITTACACWLIG